MFVFEKDWVFEGYISYKAIAKLSYNENEGSGGTASFAVGPRWSPSGDSGSKVPEDF